MAPLVLHKLFVFVSVSFSLRPTERVPTGGTATERSLVGGFVSFPFLVPYGSDVGDGGRGAARWESKRCALLLLIVARGGVWVKRSVRVFCLYTQGGVGVAGGGLVYSEGRARPVPSVMFC